MDLAKLARPWTATDGEIPTEWAQKEFYKAPVIATRIEELLGRISLFSTDGATVLRMWDPEHEPLDVGAVLAGISLTIKAWTVAISPVSPTPIESGYLECMHLVPATDGVPASEAVAAFARVQQERYAAMEPYLVEHYGALTPEREADPRFTSIDYPSFDLGPVKLGLGLFAESVQYRHSSIWCWSRAVNWHK